VTESFFLAQRATDLGSRVARERLSSLNQETARVERLLQQVSFHFFLNLLTKHILCVGLTNFTYIDSYYYTENKYL
jgi:hypothetical protein